MHSILNAIGRMLSSKKQRLSFFKSVFVLWWQRFASCLSFPFDRSLVTN